MREAHRTAESKDPYFSRKSGEFPPTKEPGFHDFWAACRRTCDGGLRICQLLQQSFL